MRTFVYAALLSAGLVALVPGTAFSQGYAPIPPGFDFPADQATLERFRDTENVDEMRRHAWYVFGGLTQIAPSGAAVWETWYPQQLVFSAATPEAEGGGQPLRPFEVPRQLRVDGATPEAAGESLLSFVMFNQEARDFIRTNGLHKASVLDQINSGFGADTPAADRHITDFPRAAVGLKLIWKIVRATQPRVLAVWDGVPSNAIADDNPESSWRRVVVVDPARADVPSGETVVVLWQGQQQAARVVSLKQFYHFQISATELAAVQQVAGPSIVVGDYAILVGMHFTTREIPNWVWATFWWHDRPSDGPFGAGRPEVVLNEWRNYRMDVAYSTDTPVEFDGSPSVAFNPYLENFPHGVASNCMACHQQARWPLPPPPDDFDASIRGTLPFEDPFFENTVRTDFLWAIPFLAN